MGLPATTRFNFEISDLTDEARRRLQGGGNRAMQVGEVETSTPPVQCEPEESGSSAPASPGAKTVAHCGEAAGWSASGDGAAADNACPGAGAGSSTDQAALLDDLFGAAAAPTPAGGETAGMMLDDLFGSAALPPPAGTSAESGTAEQTDMDRLFGEVASTVPVQDVTGVDNVGTCDQLGGLFGANAGLAGEQVLVATDSDRPQDEDADQVLRGSSGDRQTSGDRSGEEDGQVEQANEDKGQHDPVQEEVEEQDDGGSEAAYSGNGAVETNEHGEEAVFASVQQGGEWEAGAVSSPADRTHDSWEEFSLTQTPAGKGVRRAGATEVFEEEEPSPVPDAAAGALGALGGMNMNAAPRGAADRSSSGGGAPGAGLPPPPSY